MMTLIKTNSLGTTPIVNLFYKPMTLLVVIFDLNKGVVEQ
jgi:hypothetical protein